MNSNPFMTVNKRFLILYLTLKEEENSCLKEVGVGALPASPLGGSLLFWFPLAEQSLREIINSRPSRMSNDLKIVQLLFRDPTRGLHNYASQSKLRTKNEVLTKAVFDWIQKEYFN